MNMEALGSIGLPYTQKAIITSSRSLGFRFASQVQTSVCLFSHRKGDIFKACVTTSRMKFPMERNKDCILHCESYAQETNASIGNGDDPEKFSQRKRLAVFVSGGGSNFRAIYEATMSGTINADVTALVTDKPGCGGAIFARDNGIPVLPFPSSKSSPDGLSPLDLVANLRKYEVDYLLLAGYLKLVPVELVRAYPKSILNIHPSLLPAFGGKGYYGLKVHQAVIASGARYSGPTIHFVDEHYDTGHTLAQRVVPVLADDTPEKLAARVLEQEHQLYVEVASALCDDRITWREDGVPLIRSKEDPNKFY